MDITNCTIGFKKKGTKLGRKGRIVDMGGVGVESQHSKNTFCIVLKELMKMRKTRK